MHKNPSAQGNFEDDGFVVRHFFRQLDGERIGGLRPLDFPAAAQQREVAACANPKSAGISGASPVPSLD